MFDDRIAGGRGLPRNTLDRLAARFPEIHADVAARRTSGEYGFFGLVEQGRVLNEISAFADGVGQACDHVVVLGIGGSALGTKVLLEALRPAAWNELSDEAREFYPRLTVLDNVDPRTMGAALARIDPRRVLVNVISKSGGTAETMGQYLVVREWLEQALGAEALPRHLVITTDPARGPLRQIATEEGIPALDVPSNVGGRFSVLSPVGLLPAALVGIDVAGLLRGASRAADRAADDDLRENLPALYAGLQWAADDALGAHVHVLMPYADRLRQLTEWFRQLWAESLGKSTNRTGTVVNVGPTPLGAVGVTDQHSQIQLFMEGPFDKTVTVIAVEEPGDDVPIPARSELPDPVACLAGASLGALLAAERDATLHALAEAGRMSATLWLPTIDAETVGELLMVLQIATVYAGGWYGVNPLDQPGVELGKRLTYGAMGHPDFPAPERLAGEADWV
jgi:glucose-6-phosphate isomerase